MAFDKAEADRIRDTAHWPRRWLAIKLNVAAVDDLYGFIDALDVAGETEILVRGHSADATDASQAREPLDGESLPVIAEFSSVTALIDAGWRIDGG